MDGTRRDPEIVAVDAISQRVANRTRLEPDLGDSRGSERVVLDLGEVVDQQRVSRRESRSGGQLLRRQVTRQQSGSVRNIIAIVRGIAHGTHRSPTPDSVCCGVRTVVDPLGVQRPLGIEGALAHDTGTNACVLREGAYESASSRKGRAAARAGRKRPD